MISYNAFSFFGNVVLLALIVHILQVRYQELVGIASDVSFVYNVTDFTRLSDITDQLLEEACVTRPPTTTPALQPPLGTITFLSPVELT